MASYSITLADAWFRNLQAGDLSGVWKSVSCSRETKSHGRYVLDALRMEVSFLGGIEFQNLNKHLFDYSGSGTVVDRRYFVGTWKSDKPGATARGSFEFIIGPQGDYLVGTFTGNDERGNYLMCWLLGRNQTSLRRAQDFLKDQQLTPTPDF